MGLGQLLVFSLDEVDEDLIKGLNSFVHGYYTHLRSKKGKAPAAHTTKVQRLRKDGVVQTYWVTPDSATRKYFLHSNSNEIDHDSKAHLEHVKDEEGMEAGSGDLFKLSVGDTVKIKEEGKFAGLEGIVTNQALTDGDSPTVRISVKLPSPAKEGKFRVVRFGVNDIVKVKEGDPTDLLKEGKSGGAPKPKLEKEEKKIDVPEETIKERYERLRKRITINGLYRSVKSGRVYAVTALSKDGEKLKLEAPGTIDSGLVVHRKALQDLLDEGKYVRDYPISHVDKEQFPATYALESGALIDQGLIYFNEKGEAKATEEGNAVLGQVIVEHLEVLEKVAYNQAASYSNITSEDVEDMTMNAFAGLRLRLAKYEPFLGNESGGVGTFIKQKMGSIAIAYSKTISTKKNMMTSLDAMLLPPSTGDSEEASEELPGGSSFSHYYDTQILAEGLAEEYDFLASAAGFEDPVLVDVLSRWLGIGRSFRSMSVSSRKEAAEALFGYLKNQKGDPYTLESLGNFLTEAKKEISALFTGQMKKDHKFAAMIHQNLIYRLKRLRSADYEAPGYEVDKVSKEKYGVDKKEVHAAIGGALLKNGVNIDDIPHMYQVLQGVINGQYTPTILATNKKLLPTEYVAPLSKTLDGLGVKLWKFGVSGSVDEMRPVKFEEEIGDALYLMKKHKEAETANDSKWLESVMASDWGQEKAEAYAAMNPDSTEKE